MEPICVPEGSGRGLRGGDLGFLKGISGYFGFCTGNSWVPIGNFVVPIENFWEFWGP